MTEKLRSLFGYKLFLINSDKVIFSYIIHILYILYIYIIYNILYVFDYMFLSPSYKLYLLIF